MLDDPSIIPSAARRYYETHSAGEMAADAYVGATGLLTGNAASSTVVRGLNKLPVLGADVGDLAIAGRLSAGAMARAGDHSTLRQTGGGSGVDPADALYSLIRSSDNDVATVARNTGFKPSNIQKIKDHIFYNEHLLDRYVNQGIKAEIGRFQSDLDQAKAWLRLVNNQYSSKDITWLKHEIAERWYELRHRAGYSESHNAAERRWPGNPWRD